LRRQQVAPGDAVAAIDAQPFGLQRGGDDDGDGGIVLDQQNGHRPFHASQSFWTVPGHGQVQAEMRPAPASSRSWVMRPFISRTSFCTSARPSPCPFFLAVTKGSKIWSRKVGIDRAIVTDPHLDRQTQRLPARMDLDAAGKRVRTTMRRHSLSLLAGLARVGHQVEQHLHQRIGIGHDRGQRGIEFLAHRHPDPDRWRQ
jgi:hypothetical protein